MPFVPFEAFHIHIQNQDYKDSHSLQLHQILLWKMQLLNWLTCTIIY